MINPDLNNILNNLKLLDMNKPRKFLKLFFILTAILLIHACQLNQMETEEETIKMPEINKAVCVLHPTVGDSVSGVITFTKVDNGIKIDATLTGLTAGKHGFHIHQWGDCTADDGTSAGGHFNPEDTQHGGPDDAERHVGDLGNIVADASGKATYSLTDTVISFEGKHSIIGRGVIVHAGEDDLTSQPTGAAGARVACGVIGIAEMN
jgi:Cu-Zn family superoxide dismutase